MSGYLLDTNVISEFNRTGQPAEHVKHWLSVVPLESLYVSVITLGEIQNGIHLLPESKRRAQLEKWMQSDFNEWFAGRILPIDVPVIMRWAALVSAQRRCGKPISNFDGLIAATALQHGLILATRDANFRGLG